MAARRNETASLRGSKRARQITVAILEALSGELSTTEAAARLGISMSRYYQIEARALQGLLQAVEPRPKGPQKTPERALKALQAEHRQLQKELRRHQALLRAAHRSVGLAVGPQKTSSKRRAKAKRRSRGETVLRTLRKDVDDAAKGGRDGEEKRHAQAGGRDRGESARA